MKIYQKSKRCFTERKYSIKYPHFIGWMILAQLPIIIILTITNLSVKMDTLKATMSTVLYLIVVSVVVWLIRRYYRRHTYEHTGKFTTKDIGINIGWAVLLRIIVYAFCSFYTKSQGLLKQVTISYCLVI